MLSGGQILNGLPENACGFTNTKRCTSKRDTRPLSPSLAIRTPGAPMGHERAAILGFCIASFGLGVIVGIGVAAWQEYRFWNHKPRRVSGGTDG